MLASKLLPEQEEQQLQQLNDLRQEQGPTGGRQQTGYVQVCLQSAVHKKLQPLPVLLSLFAWAVACIGQTLFLEMFDTYLCHGLILPRIHFEMQQHQHAFLLICTNCTILPAFQFASQLME